MIALAAVSVLFVLLLYRPARYHPPEPAGDRQRQVSPYLTHELLPQLYNGTQRGEPFDLIVTQKGINDIVARSKWPKESNGVRFSALAVLFVPESIVLMGTANVKGVEFVVTVVLGPRLDEQGLLNLRVAGVKIGAMDITLLARAVARRMYAQRFAATDIETEDLWARIAASILNDEPFEPVFKIEAKKLRMKEITITQKKLILRLSPIPNQ